jgi:hypothetical protein
MSNCHSKHLYHYYKANACNDTSYGKFIVSLLKKSKNIYLKRQITSSFIYPYNMIIHGSKPYRYHSRKVNNLQKRINRNIIHRSIIHRSIYNTSVRYRIRRKINEILYRRNCI